MEENLVFISNHFGIKLDLFFCCFFETKLMINLLHNLLAIMRHGCVFLFFLRPSS